MKKRILAAIIAAVLTVMCLPVSAVGNAPKHPTPDGYNEHDYQKLVAFMEHEDSTGAKNGEKIVSFFNGHYDPADPAGWSYFYYDHENAIFYVYGVFFSDGENRHVTALNLVEMALEGDLDVSGCTELSEIYCDYNYFGRIDVSGCASLRALLCSECGITELNMDGCDTLDVIDCAGNCLTELDFSGCPAMRDIMCESNELDSLDVTGCPELESLYCSYNCLTELDLSQNHRLDTLFCSSNELTELDVSENYMLDWLECEDNPITEFDLSNNPRLYFDHIRVEGPGTVGYSHTLYIGFNFCDCIEAVPDEGYIVLGWYTEDGEQIDPGDHLYESDTDVRDVVVRIVDPGSIEPTPVFGDANGDGSVTAADALLVLRFAMGIADLPCDPELVDTNGDGVVDAQDALNILRFTMFG